MEQLFPVLEGSLEMWRLIFTQVKTIQENMDKWEVIIRALVLTFAPTGYTTISTILDLRIPCTKEVLRVCVLCRTRTPLGGLHEATHVKHTEQSLVPARGKHLLIVSYDYYLYLSLKGRVMGSQFRNPCTITHLFSHNQSLEREGTCDYP